MIYIGNQTSFAASVTAPFDFALANGFDAFEWFPDKKPDSGWDDRDLSASQRQEIRERARAAGIRFSVHARWQANPFDQSSYPLFWQDLELARDLGAVLLNIHLSHEQGIDAFVKALGPLADRVNEAGLALSIENTPLHSPEMFNELFAALRREGSPAFRQTGMCLDLGHANLCSATRNRYLEFIDRLSADVPLIHVHLHENWGDHDSHLPIFTGPSAQNDGGIRGLLERLHRRNFSGMIILEQWPSPPSLLSDARNRLLKMLNGSRTAEVGTPRSAVRDKPTRPAPQIEHPPKDPFAAALVDADKKSRSWREKLESVQHLLEEYAASSVRADGSTELLLYTAIYLRFLGTGQLRCEEDGRHFRPAHHARIAQAIRERVAAMTTPANAFIARKIYPWLPSSAQEFRRAEPLTRIRDIAHRNDIPSELKRELKTSLQNKLHRCAGPEDLVTASALLERITAPNAGYSSEFVEQFKIFHQELKEFFNARSLEDLLKARLGKPIPGEPELIEAFLKAKDSEESAEQFRALSALTELRGRFHELLNNGAATPGAAASNINDADAQELLMTDLALEGFAFVLLSRMLNLFDISRTNSPDADRPLLPQEQGRGRPRPRVLSKERAQRAGTRPSPPLSLDVHAHALQEQGNRELETLRLTVRNVALSEIEPEECRALESELRAWAVKLDLSSRDDLLRFKASVERSRRVAEEYSQRILELFPSRVQELGQALGVDQNAIRVFSEGDIRGHVVFQLSKLASSILRELRGWLRLPAWDVLVPGRASGRVICVRVLGDFKDDNSGPSVVLLQTAAGDEEIPTGVAAVVLAHELPHLSHLAVRARQAGIVFVAGQERSAFEEFRALDGQQLSVCAAPEQFEWKAAEPTSSAAPNDARLSAAASAKPSATRRSEPLTPRTLREISGPAICLPLSQVTLPSGGAKADNARRLAELAKSGKAIFKVPAGVVVPFGVMEMKLRAAPGLERQYRETISRLAHASPENLGSIANTLRELVLQFPVPDEILAEARKLGSGARFMVRSSSNLEDLADSAGAGLYESIPNVPLSAIPAAVREVWASLWTPRAVLSRQQSGISHSDARMAALIQTMLTPDFSFVLHTVNPLTSKQSEVYAEIAVGLGETLVSGASRGTPYRLVCDKSNGAVQTLAFANFSEALRPSSGHGVIRETIDYSRIKLSLDAKSRADIGSRFATVAQAVEGCFGAAQDIEGAIIGNEIWLVQTRPQQGLTTQRS